jgi:hypothetical protein
MKKPDYKSLTKAKAKERLLERLKIEKIISSHIFLEDEILLGTEAKEAQKVKLDSLTIMIIQKRLKRYFTDWVNPNIEILYKQ